MQKAAYKKAFYQWLVNGEVVSEPDYYKFGLTFGITESIRQACYLKRLKDAGRLAYNAELATRS